MGLEKCGLNLNAAQRELKLHGTQEFPCAGYLELLDDRTKDSVPWHWHTELEILFVKTGTLSVMIPSESFVLYAGDCAVINSSILHSAVPQPQCELHSLVFDPLLITGNADSVYAKKYLTPLTACSAFRAYQFGSDEKKEPVRCFEDAFEALKAETPGFEFTVREKLAALCYMLYLHFADSILHCDTAPAMDDIRIRKMLDFIQNRFSEGITLDQIAGAADIGARECLRCFKRTINLSPVQYLLKYRIMQGAGLLKKHPADSVTEIAAACGFDSPSYFTKAFDQFFGCSPREYRNAAILNSAGGIPRVSY